MRILFSTDQIYLHGGIEKVMAEKANYFADVLNYDVFILTTEQKENAPCYPLTSKIKRVDIGINYFRKKSYFHPSNFSKIPFHFKQWKKIIRTIKPDIIISCNYAFDFYWIPYTFKKIPKLKEYHSSRYFEEINRNKGTFLKKLKFISNDFIESKYSKLILLNQDEKQYYHTENLEIIPNPISIPNDKKASLISKKAITAGRIAPVKGFENAILTWKMVVEKNPEWELHIYGQGEANYIASLQRIIDENQLQNQVFIKPAVENFQNTMLGYSLYIMTSHTECFPMVLLESLSIGLPIVSFDCPTGPRNIITDQQDGFLVEDQNVEALAEKILLLANDENLRNVFGLQAKQNSTRFSLNSIMPLWQELFEKLKTKN